MLKEIQHHRSHKTIILILLGDRHTNHHVSHIWTSLPLQELRIDSWKGLKSREISERHVNDLDDRVVSSQWCKVPRRLWGYCCCCCSMVHIKVLGCSQIIMFLVDCATTTFSFTSIYTYMCMIIANKGQQRASSFDLTLVGFPHTRTHTLEAT